MHRFCAVAAAGAAFACCAPAHAQTGLSEAAKIDMIMRLMCVDQRSAQCPSPEPCRDDLARRTRVILAESLQKAAVEVETENAARKQPLSEAEAAALLKAKTREFTLKSVEGMRGALGNCPPLPAPK